MFEGTERTPANDLSGPSRRLADLWAATAHKVVRRHLWRCSQVGCYGGAILFYFQYFIGFRGLNTPASSSSSFLPAKSLDNGDPHLGILRRLLLVRVVDHQNPGFQRITFSTLSEAGRKNNH